jgi:acyl-CoA thioesterase I
VAIVHDLAGDHPLWPFLLGDCALVSEGGFGETPSKRRNVHMKALTVEMNKRYKLTISLFALVLSAFASATAAPTPPPKVVFIGDYITYEWASAFAANPNWINQGDSNPNINNGDSLSALARFQSDVVNLHPAIVHILLGAYDAYAVSDQSALFDFQRFLSNLDAMVKEAQAANIQVILGTTPPISTNNSLYVTQINAAIAAYGAAHNIPVIDYADLQCGCTSLSTANPFGLYGTTNMMVSTPNVVPAPDTGGILPSAAGYAQMTQLAETAVATLNLTLKSGWLQDVEQPNETLNGSPINVNTVAPPATVQFTPIGLYSDGSQHSLLNPNVQGATGTWTSSNPVVMNINQQGLAWALSNGTTIIRYTSPTGVAFSEWVMYVNAPTE